MKKTYNLFIGFSINCQFDFTMLATPKLANDFVLVEKLSSRDWVARDDYFISFFYC